jgi:hypothetical protein
MRTLQKDRRQAADTERLLEIDELLSVAEGGIMRLAASIAVKPTDGPGG